jgi:hypothetical protein
MRVCVYTVITNNYDTLPVAKDDGFDYVCFTDNDELTSETWQIRLLEKTDNPKLLSRKPKILCHKYLPEYDYSIYIDGNFDTVGSISELFNRKKEYPFTLVLHSLARSIRDEIQKVVSYDMETKETTDKLLQYMSDEGYEDKRRTFYRCGFLMRNHSDPHVNKLMECWWELVERFSHRDQLTFPIALWKSNYPYKFSDIAPSSFYRYFSITRHSKEREYAPKVHYFTPGASHRNVEQTYNEACALVTNPTDWICIRDIDTLMFTEPNCFSIIEAAIKKYPTTDLFSCYTNRLGLKYQLHDGKLDDNLDLRHLQKIAQERYDTFGDECEQIKKPIAGIFLLFQRSLFDKIKFDGNVVGDDGSFFDYRFTSQVLKLKKTIRLIKGLYVPHYYRAHKHIRNTSHLL